MAQLSGSLTDKQVFTRPARLLPAYSAPAPPTALHNTRLQAGSHRTLQPPVSSHCGLWHQTAPRHCWASYQPAICAECLPGIQIVHISTLRCGQIWRHGHAAANQIETGREAAGLSPLYCTRGGGCCSISPGNGARRTSG